MNPLETPKASQTQDTASCSGLSEQVVGSQPGTRQISLAGKRSPPSIAAKPGQARAEPCSTVSRMAPREDQSSDSGAYPHSSGRARPNQARPDHAETKPGQVRPSHGRPDAGRPRQAKPAQPRPRKAGPWHAEKKHVIPFSVCACHPCAEGEG